MRLIVNVDKCNGLMFNHRRQSKDRIIREDILRLLAPGEKLYVSNYTATQFTAAEASWLCVTDTLDECNTMDIYYFAEDILPHPAMVEQLILYRWDRTYPADQYFDFTPFRTWQQRETTILQGYSHDNIQREIYERSGE